MLSYLVKGVSTPGNRETMKLGWFAGDATMRYEVQGDATRRKEELIARVF
jgi:hypothetical protein